MITAVRRKLSENRGATMILALILMLVCVMISSIVLAAAASGASRHVGREEQQQAYLAVSSATELLAEDLKSLQKLQNPDTLLLEQLRFVGYHEVKHYGCLDCTIVATMEYNDEFLTGTRLEAAFVPAGRYKDEGHLIYDDPNAHAGAQIINGKYLHTDSGDIMKKDPAKSTADAAFKDTILGDLVMDAAEYVYCNEKAYKESFEITMDEPAATLLPKVICYFTMDEEYDITIEVTTENKGYSMIISMNGVFSNGLQTESGSGTQEISCVHRVYYKSYDNTNGIYTDTMAEWTIPGTKTYSNVFVTWNPPTIKKGVSSE